MEHEKIKIYVTKRVADILEKDAETFEFIKSDGITPNKNALLTTLIINYWESFRESQNKIHHMIASVLRENTILNDDKINNLSSLIENKVNKEYALDLVDKFSSPISLKPTKQSQPIIDYIEAYLLENCSLSEYFRNMFTSYSALPQDKREEIIFKTQYSILSQAINSKKKVFIRTNGKSSSAFEIEPYMFSRSKEEMHIYLLYKNNLCRSIKLSKIKSVTVLNREVKFSDNNLKTFDKMLKFGAQFSYGENEEEVVVKLTPRGQKIYHKIYVHRPIPSKIEGDMFTFNCSHTQIIQYFSRFGKEVEIISPENIKEVLFDFHNGYVINSKK